MTAVARQAAPAGTSWRRGVLPGLLPVLALLLLGYLVPMGTVLWTSMHRGSAFGFAAYAEVLSSAAILHILLPMIVLPIYASMQRIDPALLLAARNLGGSPASVFGTVFLPLSAPGVIAGCALVFLSALGFYVTPALLGSPGDYLIAQAIEVRVTTLAEFDTASAQACLLFLVVGGALFVLRHW